MNCRWSPEDHKWLSVEHITIFGNSLNSMRWESCPDYLIELVQIQEIWFNWWLQSWIYNFLYWEKCDRGLINLSNHQNWGGQTKKIQRIFWTSFFKNPSRFISKQLLRGGCNRGLLIYPVFIVLLSSIYERTATWKPVLNAQGKL
jgi:hypothetical protein